MTENNEKKLDKTELAKLKKSMRNKRYYEKKKTESSDKASEGQAEDEQNFFFANQTNTDQTSRAVAPMQTIQAPPANHALRDSLIITCVPILLPFIVRLAGGIYLKTIGSKPQEQSHQQSQVQSTGLPITTLAQL